MKKSAFLSSRVQMGLSLVLLSFVAYALLVREWLSHMEHLKADYPYLFSLAARTNPFDSVASVEVTWLSTCTAAPLRRS